MRKFLKNLALGIVILFTIIALWIVINFARWPVSLIKIRLVSLTPFGTDFNQVKIFVGEKKWEISQIDEANGVDATRNDGSCEDKRGYLSEEWRRYECTKSFSYSYACEVTGGRMGKKCKSCAYDVCMSNGVTIPVDQRETCHRGEGKWVLKISKITPYCEFGKKWIKASLGEYMTLFPLPLPLVTSTYATWIFDEDGKLIDISIEKGIEGP